MYILCVSPVANLTNWDYNITVCLGLDSLQLLLTMVGFAVLTSTIYILDRYFNSHYVIRRMVNTYVHIKLFNSTLITKIQCSKA